ncbi:MAG: PAS domain-containing protein, partial [Planctomycetales bacterium]|nr:PAS domain-containing protein [Planctomycetales bacterium]
MNAKQETTRAAATRTPLIVGVGASAGGLEACADLLERLGNVEGLAIVFVQHLEPTGNSLLVELLSRHTPMKVSELSGRTKIKAGHLYVAPPHSLLRLKNGFVSVETQTEPPHRANSIDHFFHALAGDQGELAVGVILSGSGSDGTLGLKAISDSGGLTFAQDPATAKFDSMPRSAATTGVADHVMSPAQIAAEIVAYRQHLGELNSPPSHGWRDDIGDTIPLIAEVLLKTTNHNFQHYKSSTLSRRIQRRMQLLRLSRADDYVARIREDADEARALFRELLIGVTAFFRDPEAFQSLARIVLPKLFENRTPGDCVRMWVAGCATGEEAYSLAILCREYLDHLPSRPEVQIFATDIDERALQIARNGSYPSGIEEQVSNDRLKRFFVKRGKRYTIVKEIRDMVLFSAHNLISDPPFSRQDLICCRNLLIYLGPHLQKKLIPLFHYALRPGGFLFLGPSESITSHTELFRPCDARFRISQRKGTAIGSTRPLPLIPSNTSGPIGDPNAPVPTVELSEIRQRIILDEFAPKAVIIDETGQVLNASDNLQKYLRLGEGDFQNNILKMADRGLRMGLRAAISEAIKTRRRVQHEDLSIHDGEFVQRVMLTVQPMPRLGEDEGLFIVVFHDVGLPFHRGADLVAEPGNSHRNADSIIAQMERELESTREDLDRTMQEMEAANEELKSSNEELLSMNEELQSANEELETSKEEIRENSDAMARINNDLENLLRSTQIATIFLDQEYLIRGFTPAVTVIYDLIATDIGRPLSLFVPHVENMPPLPDQETLYERGVMEDTILAENGRSYIRRVLPYRTHVGDTEGIVVTFTDVTELRESEQRLSLALDATSDGAWDWNISTGELVFSDRWLASLGYASDEVAAHVEFRDSIVHPDDRPRKQELLERHFRGDTETYYCEKRLRMKSGHYRWTLARGRVVQFDDAGQPLRMVGTDTDISERMHAQLELEARERQLKTITDAIPPLIAFVDREQRYQFVNAAYARDWKCDIADLIGRKVQDVL